MSISWSKFFPSHSTIIVLVIFNITILILFTLIYTLCEMQNPNSFNNVNPKSEVVLTNFTDHLLLSIAIQSGIGLSNITPVTNTAKILVSLQQFLVMTSGLVSIYLFIYFSVKQK